MELSFDSLVDASNSFDSFGSLVFLRVVPMPRLLVVNFITGGLSHCSCLSKVLTNYLLKVSSKFLLFIGVKLDTSERPSFVMLSFFHILPSLPVLVVF